MRKARTLQIKKDITAKKSFGSTSCIRKVKTLRYVIYYYEGVGYSRDEIALEQMSK